MYKIMIADDEPIFTEFLKRSIAFQELNCVLCGCAQDGVEAVLQMKRNHPDIVLMDINMPNKDGLAACREIKDFCISTKIIILTAHDEFHFAQKSVKLGVFDYLLKPFDKEELNSSLKKCINQIKRERQKDNLFDKDVLEERAAYLKAVIKLEIQAKGSEIPNELVAASYIVCLFRGIHDFKHQDVKSYYVGEYQSMSVVVYLLEEEQTLLEVQEMLTETKEQNKFEAVAVGGKVQFLEDLYKSYQQAIICMENRIQVKKNIILFEDIAGFDGKRKIYAESDVEILIKYFESSQYEKADLIIEKIFDINKNKVLSFQYVVAIYFSLLTNLYEHYHKQDGRITEHMTEQGQLLKELNTCNSTEEVQETIKNYLYEVLSDCKEYTVYNKSHALVEKIDEYLEEHFSNQNLSVQQISEEMYFENSYLRRLYKTYRNKTIMQALEDIRMEKAKKLLAETDLKLSYIAEKIGFADSFYFSRRFKLNVNVAPSDYRWMYRKKGGFGNEI